MIAKQSYDRSDIRRMNAVNVLQELKVKGPLSRANIAGNLGLTRATISNIAQELLNASLIQETEYDDSKAGRPGLLLALNGNCGSMIGVDIDLDRISVVLSNMGTEILWREEMALTMESSAEDILEQCAELMEHALGLAKLKKLNCFGICVALAGLVNRVDGRLEYGPTSGWSKVDLKANWESRFDVPVYIENEAHVAAIGTFHSDAMAGVNNLIYLSLGVGLAAGVFVDGVLLRGERGFAGQVGHVNFADNGIKCGCGKTGCWVTEIGASALKRKLADAGVKIPSKIGQGVDWVELVSERAAAGDAAVMKVLEGVGEQIGRGLAQLVQTFNPSQIVVGGRMGQLIQYVEPTIRKTVFAETLSYMTDPLEVSVSASGEDHLKGCLATVMDEIITNPRIGAANNNGNNGK